MARPENRVQRLGSREMGMSAGIAEIALGSLLQEYKDLISVGVGLRAAELRRTGRGSDEMYARDSEEHLSQWLTKKFPFCYLREALQHLVYAVVTDPTAQHRGLPDRQANAMTLRAWVTLIVDMAFPNPDSAPISIGVPLSATGPALNVCRAAVAEIRDYASVHQHRTPERDFVVTAFMHAADALKINFVPWSIPHTRARGRNGSKAVYDRWATLGEPENRRPNQAMAEDPLVVHCLETEKDDCCAEWSACRTPIKDLCNYVKRTVPPCEWKLISTSVDITKPGIVPKTYKYVWNSFNLQIPLHHLALLTAIIFSKTAPRISWDGIMPITGLSTETLTNIARQMPFVKGNAKGGTDTKAIIVIMTVYIIAMYDQNSPARRSFDENDADAVKPWGTKHTAKKFTPLQLVRLGLARALNCRLWKAGRMDDFELLSAAEIRHRHRQLITFFDSGPDGAFHAAIFVLGEEEAIHLATSSSQLFMDTSFTPAPKESFLHLITSTATKKRSRGSDNDDDDEGQGGLTRRPKKGKGMGGR